MSKRERWPCASCGESVRPVVLRDDPEPACPCCGYYFPAE